MFLIGMLGDNFGSLDNDVQALLKPTHIRSQSDEMLEIGVAQNTVSDTLADERTNAMLGDLLKRGISPFAELLKRAPGRSRNKGQGGRAGKRGGHGETSTKRIARLQRYSNEIVVPALPPLGPEIKGVETERRSSVNIQCSRHCRHLSANPNPTPKYQYPEPVYNYLALFNSTNRAE
jgi:hypothetical protein